MAKHPAGEECYKFTADFESRQEERIENTRSSEEMCISWGEEAMAAVGGGGWKALEVLEAGEQRLLPSPTPAGSSA